MTPSQLKTTPWERTVKVCRDYTARGIETISQLSRGDGRADKAPMRFVYISGSSAERDQTKKPLILGDYLLLRVCLELPCTRLVTSPSVVLD